MSCYARLVLGHERGLKQFSNIRRQILCTSSHVKTHPKVGSSRSSDRMQANPLRIQTQKPKNLGTVQLFRTGWELLLKQKINSCFHNRKSLLNYNLGSWQILFFLLRYGLNYKLNFWVINSPKYYLSKHFFLFLR